ncbi:SPFH domain-containing protein [Methylomonas sp. SURF-2]|uniref:SPFH domain-containing protein n=1 Tax=Methylomonas subterranea TaxID=2952225 RepID=A0ABT1TEE3_9GAMM|nr:SPFH domain-containing protein [Methylomonas sp. SURF-2]MCQ8103129.1 SPFH domain-containing protein [Methylomonas sp. SURF-2]
MSTVQASENPFRRIGKIRFWHVLGLLLVGVMLISPPWFIVQPSEMANVRRLGKILHPAPLADGWYFKVPWLDEVDILQVSLTGFQANDLPIFTMDNQWINVSVGISFSVPEAAVLNLLYKVGRSGDFDIGQNLRPVLSESAMLVFSRHLAEKLPSEREQLVKELETELSAALQRVFGLTVEDVQIININYLSERAAQLCNELKQMDNQPAAGQ